MSPPGYNWPTSARMKMTHPCRISLSEITDQSSFRGGRHYAKEWDCDQITRTSFQWQEYPRDFSWNRAFSKYCTQISANWRDSKASLRQKERVQARSLQASYEENRLDKRMRVYLRPRILIVDEVGYLPLEPLAANLFFQLVSARYEKGSMILTSNKSFGEWGELMGDSVLATAVFDRLLHHCHVINIRGNSYRLKEKIKAGIYSTPSAQVGQNYFGANGSNWFRRWQIWW